MEQALKDFGNNLFQVVSSFGLKLIVAIIVLLVGMKISKVLVGRITKSKGYHKLDKTVQSFVKSLLTIVFYSVIIIVAASIIGIPAASFITVLASAGVAIGLAFQGSLSNLAGGLMLLIFKPFSVGDYIDATGGSGTVVAVNVFYTIILTPDNKQITLPNGTLTNSAIVNYSAEKTRRVDIPLSVAYGTDIELVRKTLLTIAASEKAVLPEPAPVVIHTAQASSSLDFELRVWCNTEDYWAVKGSLTEKTTKACDTVGIEIPFQQIDIHQR